VTKKTARRWSLGVENSMKRCFEERDWNVFCEPHGDDTIAISEYVSEYNDFCLKSITCTRTVRCFRSNGISTDLEKAAEHNNNN